MRILFYLMSCNYCHKCITMKHHGPLFCLGGFNSKFKYEWTTKVTQNTETIKKKKDKDPYMITSWVCETWERMSLAWTEVSCNTMNNIINLSYSRQLKLWWQHSNDMTCLLFTINYRMRNFWWMFFHRWSFLIHFDWINSPKPNRYKKHIRDGPLSVLPFLESL